MWYDVLTRTFHCDRASIMELILLAQLSPEGYDAANGIISKIFKAVSDSKTLDNPSGFLHLSVCHIQISHISDTVA